MISPLLGSLLVPKMSIFTVVISNIEWLATCLPNDVVRKKAMRLSSAPENFWQKDCCFVNFADGESFCSEEKIKRIS